jgi:hypothetical protein
LTVPLPDPLEVVVIQLTLLVAVQAQPAGAETVKLLFPPNDEIDEIEGDTV